MLVVSQICNPAAATLYILILTRLAALAAVVIFGFVRAMVYSILYSVAKYWHCDALHHIHALHLVMG